VTEQLLLLPLASWLVTLPVTQAAAAYLYWWVAPLWVFVGPGLLFVAATAAQWWLQRQYKRSPDSRSLTAWGDLATAIVVVSCLAQGLLFALLATCPGDKERVIGVVAVTFMVTLVPSRWDARLFVLSVPALLVPMAAVLVFGAGTPVPRGLLFVLGGGLFAYIVATNYARKRLRVVIGREYAALDEAAEQAALRREAERARDLLSDARRQTEMILGGIDNAIVLFGPDRRLVYFNEAAERMLDDDPIEVRLGMTLEDVARAFDEVGDHAYVDGRRLTPAERVAPMFAPGGLTYVRMRPSGRYIEFNFRTLPDGSLIGFHRDVTDQKNQEAETAAAQRRMIAVLDNMTDGVRLYDADTRLVYQNKAIADLFGIESSDEIGLPVEQLFRRRIVQGNEATTEGQRIALEGRLAVFQAGGSYDVRLPTGRHVETVFHPIGGGGRLAVFRDITELQLRQDELERARDEIYNTQQLMDTILGGMPDGVGLFTTDGTLIYENAAVKKIYGVPADAWKVGMTNKEIVQAQAAAGIPLAEDGKVDNIEDANRRVTDPGGHTYQRELPNGRHIEASFRPLGRDRVLGMLRDITDLKLQQAEVSDTQRFMTTVLDNMTDGVRLFDSDERLVYQNKAVAAMFGTPEGGPEMGMRMEEILKWRMVAQKAAARGGPVPEVADRLAHFRNPQGGHYELQLESGQEVEIHFRPIGNGRIIGVYRDITELRHQQEEIERSRDAAEAANRAKSAFLATMSHEIRTPMNGVIATAELLGLQPIDREQKRLVDTIQVSAKALLGIIDEVLDFSKIEAERLELAVTPFLLRSLIRGAIETFQAEAERKRIKITTMVALDVPELMAGDATRLRQILLNLIGNALKFTETGEIRVSARAQFTDEGRVRLAISVADTGVGMSREEIGRLFLPFFQADNTSTRRYGGTGLGLSIVQRLAAMMDGDVTVSSTEHQGSTFTVTLTLDLAGPIPEEKPALVAADAGRSAGAVLAIDDSAINLEVLVGQLKALGVAVETATDGVEGLARWRERPYALVITDIQMPGMDGFEMARLIRSEEALAGKGERTPIVALSANALKGEDEKAMAAGLDGYLTKPVTLRRLQQTIGRWVATKTPETTS
jgi:signal transduction histidine kinase/ActR/RegA family two-component response regulator